MFACSGILYNHESPRRPLDFLPRKVAHGAASISLGLQDELVLGDLDARRDWGYAGDYVRAMWLMLQQNEPGDYVVASGNSHSVRELVQSAFAHVGLDWQQHVRVDPALQRGAAECIGLSETLRRPEPVFAGSRRLASRSSCSFLSRPTSTDYAQEPAPRRAATRTFGHSWTPSVSTGGAPST